MRLLKVLSVFLSLAACSRGLTEQETVFARALFGETLDTEVIDVRAGIGIGPLPRPEEPDPEAEPVAPRKLPAGFCTREPQPHRAFTWPAAFVYDNDIFFSYKFYSADTMAGFPEHVALPAALIMAHELVHVWQWQNRARTGYTPEGSAGESVRDADPYFFTPEAGRDFFAYGFEQQAAMIEDYVCYRFFEPRAPRLRELHAILAPVLTLDDFEAAIRR